jgi:hypothetical protein
MKEVNETLPEIHSQAWKGMFRIGPNDSHWNAKFLVLIEGRDLMTSISKNEGNTDRNVPSS